MQSEDRPWHERDEFAGARRFSDGVLRLHGAFARIPPNVVTLIGAVLALPMCLAFASGAVLLGAILFALSAATDWLDGALSRYQYRLAAAGRLNIVPRTEWLRLGPTELGKKIDPLVDKIRYFAALFPLGWQILPHALVWTAFCLAAGLTGLRVFVEKRWKLRPGANLWGKFKAYAEIVAIGCLVFLASGVSLKTVSLIAVIVATALGMVSLLTQAASAHRQLRASRR